MAGLDTEFDGEAQLAPGATVGLLEQEPTLDPTKDVARQRRGGRGRDPGAARPLQRALDELLRRDRRRVRARAGADRRRRRLEPRHHARDRDGRAALPARRRRRHHAVRRRAPARRPLPAAAAPARPAAARRAHQPPRRRVGGLARAPPAGLPGTVVAVTHDRYFLDNVAGWILELDRGRGIPYQGNYSGWLEQKHARLEPEARQESRSQADDRARARVGAARTPAPGATSPRPGSTPTRRCSPQDRNVKLDQVQIHIPAGPRLGDLVVEAEDLRKGYGDRLLIDDLSFTLPRGGIVGVIGPNGAGKTTLLRMITGQEQPDAGALRLGDTVELAYVDQSRDALDPTKTVWEEISGGADQITLGDRTVNSRAYVAGFNFKGTDQQKKVAKLSGGERNRLHLAKLLRSGGNLLLLDEPTNDLDVDTLRALEEALLAFAGCAVVISHDRWFLDRIATHVLAFEGDSQVRWFEGNFEAYESFRREQLGAEADRPKRITTRSSSAARYEHGAGAARSARRATASAARSSSTAERSRLRPRRTRRPSARAQAMSRGVSPITIVRSRGYGAPPAGAAAGDRAAARRGPRRRSRTRPDRGVEPAADPGAPELQPRDRPRSCRSRARASRSSRRDSCASSSGIPGARCATDPRRAEPRVGAARLLSRPRRRRSSICAAPTARVEQDRARDLAVGAAGRRDRTAADRRPSIPCTARSASCSAARCSAVAPHSSVPSMSNSSSNGTRAGSAQRWNDHARLEQLARTPRSASPPHRCRPPRPSRPASACSGTARTQARSERRPG